VFFFFFSVFFFFLILKKHENEKKKLKLFLETQFQIIKTLAELGGRKLN